MANLDAVIGTSVAAVVLTGVIVCGVLCSRGKGCRNIDDTPTVHHVVPSPRCFTPPNNGGCRNSGRSTPPNTDGRQNSGRSTPPNAGLGSPIPGVPNNTHLRGNTSSPGNPVPGGADMPGVRPSDITRTSPFFADLH